MPHSGSYPSQEFTDLKKRIGAIEKTLQGSLTKQTIEQARDDLVTIYRDIGSFQLDDKLDIMELQELVELAMPFHLAIDLKLRS